jgi:GntR family transcriptional regulator, transcriptional repressor for pyruvate dehydrogenase complex
VLAKTAGNELMMAFTSWILEVLQPSLVEYMGHSIDGEEILEQHRRILRAIRRGQSAAAQRAMRQHIEYLRRVVRRLDSRSRSGS